MRVRWTRPALADFLEAQEYIASKNPHAAFLIAERVWQATRHLSVSPYSGRVGHVGNTREWVVDRTPYLIIYRIGAEELEILRLWHGRRNWRDA